MHVIVFALHRPQCPAKAGLIARSSIRDGVRFASCWPTSWLNVAGGLSKSLLCFQARRARLAAMSMLAIGVIKRPSFALHAAMAIMPTLTQRSIFYGVRTCALKPVEGYRKRPVEAGTIRSAAQGCSQEPSAFRPERKSARTHPPRNQRVLPKDGLLMPPSGWRRPHG